MGDIGDRVSYRPASLCTVAWRVRYDNPMPESTLSPMDYEFGYCVHMTYLLLYFIHGFTHGILKQNQTRGTGFHCVQRLLHRKNIFLHRLYSKERLLRGLNCSQGSYSLKGATRSHRFSHEFSRLRTLRAKVVSACQATKAGTRSRLLCSLAGRYDLSPLST